MSEYQEQSYKQPNGEEIVTWEDNGFHVACYDPTGENRWFLSFKTEAEALAEFNRWKQT